MDKKYLIVEEASVTDLETELNKDDYADYEVVAASYTGSKVCAILKKVYFR